MVPKQSLFFFFFWGVGGRGGRGVEMCQPPLKKSLNPSQDLYYIFIYSKKHNAVDAAVNRDLKIQTNRQTSYYTSGCFPCITGHHIHWDQGGLKYSLKPSQDSNLMIKILKPYLDLYEASLKWITQSLLFIIEKIF